MRINRLVGVLVVSAGIAGLVIIPEASAQGPIAKLISALQSVKYGKDDPTYQLEYAGRAREYKVHLPKGAADGTKFPVVIYLHGGGGNLTGAYRDGLETDADNFGFVLAVPAGTGKVANLLTWNGGRWDCGSRCGYALENNVDDLGFIAQMIEELKKNYAVDEKRIYATGISNGAIMAYRLACELSDKIAAVAAVAPPGVPPQCANAQPIPIMHIHGTADPLTAFFEGGENKFMQKTESHPLSAQKSVDAWRTINGCSADSQEVYKNKSARCVSYSGCSNDAETVFCTVEGMGHAWPSGNQYLPVKTVGPVSQDISFTQIWEFFQRHPKK